MFSILAISAILLMESVWFDTFKCVVGLEPCDDKHGLQLHCCWIGSHGILLLFLF